jgi:cytochrome subunit of sulfide dehydrogenase
MRKMILIPLLFGLTAQVQAAADCNLTFNKTTTPKTISTNNPNGELLASQCYQCHGYEGRSLGEIDSIAGKSASDLYGDLIDFKNNGKKDIMSLQARQYSDCELEAIANYLSSLPN